MPEKRRSIKISRLAHKVFKDIVREFEVNDREMTIIEMFDKLAAHRPQITALLRK